MQKVATQLKLFIGNKCLSVYSDKCGKLLIMENFDELGKPFLFIQIPTSLQDLEWRRENINHPRHFVKFNPIKVRIAIWKSNSSKFSTTIRIIMLYHMWLALYGH